MEFDIVDCRVDKTSHVTLPQAGSRRAASVTVTSSSCMVILSTRYDMEARVVQFVWKHRLQEHER